jgi:aspartate 1-decarboxylase
MFFNICKSKIAGLIIKSKELHYKEGSISLSQKLIAEANILPYEIVLVLNLNNGERLLTYVISDLSLDKREAKLNGPAARCGEVGDELIILSFAWVTPEESSSFKPKIIQL